MPKPAEKEPPKPVDNGLIEAKLLLRLRLLEMLDKPRAIDFFAGRGEICARLAPRLGELIAVEKDGRKAAALEFRLGLLHSEGLLAKRPRVFAMDNLKFVRQALPGLPDSQFLDFDAYGCPNRLVREVFNAIAISAPKAVAVTDGGRMSLLRGGDIRLDNYGPAPGENAEHGMPAMPGRARIRPLSMAEYEALLKQFWRELGRETGFCVTEWLSLWRKGGRVVYYGLQIEPN